MTYAEFSALLEKTPDAEQEKVVQALKNTIVSAGAGSGKTQTLANRFVYLITADLTDEKGNAIKNPSVDRILTLTFTNKAAAEMYQRIYGALKDFSKKAKDPDAKQKALAAIENFSKARIQTLDSYSASILRQAAASYGIRPDFTSGEGSPRIKEAAFDFAMKNRASPYAQWISEPAKFEECADFFADAAIQFSSLADSINAEKKCSRFQQSLEAQKKAVEKLWHENEHPLFKVEKTIAKIELGDRPARNPEWFDKLSEALDYWDSEKTKKARAFIKEQFARPPIFESQEALASFAASDQVLHVQNALKKFEITNKISDKGTSHIVKNELLGENKKCSGLIREFNGIIAFFSDCAYLEGLSKLLDEFVDEANGIKRRTGELTFSDVNDLALAALKENEVLQKEERDAYDFIMIDEFQDNNAQNRDLLLAISTGDDGKVMQNRLFFVGDEKQSIYKFRGADVSVFKGLANYLGSSQMLPMRRNYRSNNILLDEFNQIFGGFLPGQNESPAIKDQGQDSAGDEKGPAKIFEEKSAKDYKAAFDKDALALFPETKQKIAKTGQRIQACLFKSSGIDKDAALEEKNAIALHIAKKIKALNDGGVPFSKIALLVKGRTNYPNIARIFSLNGIPFSLDEQGNIFARAAANDFYNALRLCVYPADLNAFAAFLTSPFAGMDFLSAQKILSLNPSRAFDPSIQAQEILDTEAHKKYEAAGIFLDGFSRFALSRPISDSVERLWEAEGYKFSKNADEEHYDLLFELARKADADSKDLSWFVDQLAAAKEQSFKSDSEIDIKGTDYPVEKQDAVQVMTIHKSKGLEFDYVFVWGIAGSKGGGRPGESKIFKSQEYGLVVANGKKSQSIFSVLAAAEDYEKEMAEFRRLIYVALTRAGEGLYIMGTRPSNAESEAPLRDLIFAYEKDAEEALPEMPFEIEEIPPYPRGSEYPAQKTERPSNNILAELYQNAPLKEKPRARMLWTSPSGLEEKDKKEREEKGPASLSYPEINAFVNQGALEKKHYGTLFHSFMENWAKARGAWTRETVTADEYFKSEPLVQKISKGNREILLETFFKILDAFLAKKENPALSALEAGRDFKAECKFKTKIDSYIFSGSIDALFKNADGTWTVLDYKTDAREEPEIYFNQLAAYKKTAADLEADGDVHKIKCVLFYAESGNFIDVTQEAQEALESLDDEKILNIIEKNENL